jgi:hypothetical protein
VSFFELVLADHSKDHAVAVAYISDTLTAEPYTTLRDSTRWFGGPRSDHVRGMKAPG